MSEPPDRRENEALCRYELLQELLAPDLTPAERGRIVARLAKEGLEVLGERLQLSRATIYRYLKAFSLGGAEALKRKVRSDAGSSKAIPKRILERAVSLRHTEKRRAGRHMVKMLEQQFPAYRQQIKESTLNRHLDAAGASRRQLGIVRQKVFKRFEAEAPNVRWIGDVMHGCPELRVVVPGHKGRHKVYLFAWVDDYARFVPHSEWYLVERLPSLEDCFKKATLAHGLPDQAYPDNGAIYRARAWKLALAELEVRITKRAPHNSPAGGKMEKLWQTARAFEIEAVSAGICTIGDLNEAWWAYLLIMVHDRIHDETHEKPLDRYARLTSPRYPDPVKLNRLFLLREERTVNVKFSTVSVRGRPFRVDPHLRGRKVEVRFDPYALDRVYIWYRRREVQIAYPASPANLPEPPKPEPAEPTAAQREDARGFLRGLVDEAREKKRRAFPGLDWPSPTDPSSAAYSWSAFTDHLASTLGRPFADFTDPERNEAQRLWRDHGPLNRQWVQAALIRAVAAKGTRQHLAFYLDQIKILHFDEASTDEDRRTTPGDRAPGTKGTDHA